MWVSSSAVWLLAACCTRSVEKDATGRTKVGHVLGYSLLFFLLFFLVLFIHCMCEWLQLQIKTWSFVSEHNLESLLYQWRKFSRLVSDRKQITEYWYLIFSCGKHYHCSQHTPAATRPLRISAVLPRLPACTCPAWIRRPAQPYSTTLILGSWWVTSFFSFIHKQNC